MFLINPHTPTSGSISRCLNKEVRLEPCDHTLGAYKKFQNPILPGSKLSLRQEGITDPPKATPKPPEHMNRGIVEPVTGT